MNKIRQDRYLIEFLLFLLYQKSLDSPYKYTRNHQIERPHMHFLPWEFIILCFLFWFSQCWLCSISATVSIPGGRFKKKQNYQLKPGLLFHFHIGFSPFVVLWNLQPEGSSQHMMFQIKLCLVDQTHFTTNWIGFSQKVLTVERQKYTQFPYFPDFFCKPNGLDC